MTLDDCERIFHQALSSGSGPAFCHAVNPLFAEYQILSLQVGRGSMYWRARLIENEIFPNLSDLDYPPPQYAKQGRVNDHGVPCFYVAARKETALAEIGATKGQRIQLAGFRVKSESPIRLVVIGEYANVQKTGYMRFTGQDPEMTISQVLNAMPRHEAMKKLYIDKFFASVLSDPSASASGYMFSRALAKSIYSRVTADGIVFSSVKDRGGFNIAVQAGPSDRSFHNVSCLVVHVEKIRQFGLIEFKIIKSAGKMDDDWNFIWTDSSDSETIGVYNLTKEEFEAASRNSRNRNSLLHMLHANAKRK
jgi:hypothetical protein